MGIYYLVNVEINVQRKVHLHNSRAFQLNNKEVQRHNK